MDIFFIGAGPGDPELLTIKGKRIMDRADIIIYAGSLVPEELLKSARKDAVLYNSAGMTLKEVTDIYFENRQLPGIVARVHTGDPSIYGAVQEQIGFLRDNKIHFEIIPGVSSFQAAAAVLEQELTLPGVSQTVVLSRISGRTKTPALEDLSLLARSRSTMVLFLSAGNAAEVQQKLSVEYPGTTPVAVVYRAGWPDQRVFRGVLKDLGSIVDSNALKRHALIFIGDVLSGEYEESSLYSPDFTHCCRKGSQ